MARTSLFSLIGRGIVISLTCGFGISCKIHGRIFMNSKGSNKAGSYIYKENENVRTRHTHFWFISRPWETLGLWYSILFFFSNLLLPLGYELFFLHLPPFLHKAINAGGSVKLKTYLRLQVVVIHTSVISLKGCGLTEAHVAI